MEYDNTNRGTLGRNKRKEQDSHPDYSGKINVDGRDYWLSGWLKESNGEKFFSLSVKPKDGAAQNHGKRQPPPPTDDEDIPF